MFVYQSKLGLGDCVQVSANCTVLYKSRSRLSISKSLMVSVVIIVVSTNISTCNEDVQEEACIRSQISELNNLFPFLLQF